MNESGRQEAVNAQRLNRRANACCSVATKAAARHGLASRTLQDAASTSEQELTQLPPHGGAAIRGFCGLDELAKNWDERGVCVLKARKGLGKSHLFKARSSNHRDSTSANRTIFYPQGGHPRPLIDALSSLHVVVPRWLQGKEAAAAWMNIWQLSILGLMVWITGARSGTLCGYADWFRSLEQVDQVQRQNQPGAPESGQPNVMLTWFMGRILERMPVDDYVAGTDALKIELTLSWLTPRRHGRAGRLQGKTGRCSSRSRMNPVFEVDGTEVMLHPLDELLTRSWG